MLQECAPGTFLIRFSQSQAGLSVAFKKCTYHSVCVYVDVCGSLWVCMHTCVGVSVCVFDLTVLIIYIAC